MNIFRSNTRLAPLSGTRSRRDRDGSYAMLLVLSLPVVLGVGAIAVDLSYQKVVRTEVQAAADIAALAAAAELDGTVEGIQTATYTAIRAAARNTAAGEPVKLDPSWLDFGYWDPQSGAFISSTDPELIDAVRIDLNKDEVEAAFASVAFDQPYTEVTGRSVGYDPVDGPAGRVQCALPIAVAKCLFDTNTEAELNQKILTLNPAGIDNVGWGRLGASPNASWVKAQLTDCTAQGDVAVGDVVGLQNGVIASALFEMEEAIETSDTRWDPTWNELPPQLEKSDIESYAYGNTIEGPVPVFDGGDEYCQGSGGSFTGYEPVVGFVWGAVFDVQTSGGAAEKNIRVHLDTTIERDFGTRGGGLVDAGVIYDTPVTIVH